MTYKQTNQITLPDGKKLKNFFWEIHKWGKNESSGKAFAEVYHWFIKTEKDTSKVRSRRYEKTMAGDPTLAKAETFLLALSQYTGSVQV